MIGTTSPIILPELTAEDETLIWQIENAQSVWPQLITDYLEFVSRRRRAEDRLLSSIVPWWPAPEGALDAVD